MSFDPSFQGTKNYIADRDGTKIGKWVTYADAAQTNPVDGTGGAPLSTFAVSTDSSLRGVTNFLWTHSANNRQGEGFSYDFIIDPADRGKVLQCSFEYLISSGTYADNDMSFWIYDVTNAVLIQPAPYLLKNSTIIEKFAFEFQSASNSSSYRLIAHVDTATATAYTVRFGNWLLGPQAKLYGSAITDWVSYTPTGTWVTNTTYTGKYRRVGDSLEVIARVTLTGAPTGSFTLNLPSGFVIDLTKTPGGASNQSEGLGIADFNVAGVRYVGAVGINDTSSIMINSHGAGGVVNATIPGTFASGSVIEMTFMAPIQGWSSSQVFSQDADTRVVAALIGGGSASATANNPIIYSTVGLDTHGAYSTVTGKYTAPVTGFYNINATGDGTAAAGTVYYISVNGNTTAGYNRPIIAYQEVVNQGFSGSGKVYALTGQTIDIRATNNTGSYGTNATFQIERISGPAQIAASESVSALYTGAPPTGTLSGSFSVTTYGSKIKDSHNAYSGGTYTVPVSGTYTITAQSGATGTFSAGKESSIAIFVDGVQKYRGYIEVSSAVTLTAPNVSVTSIPLLAGQAVTIQSMTTATTPAYITTASFNYFSITRTGNF